MKIHREGTQLILATFFLCFFASLSLYLWIPLPLSIEIFLYLGLLVYFLFIVRFFRSPSRTLIPDEQVVYAPADGKVVVIEEVDKSEYFGDRRIQISIFMSPHNVHVNWFPVSGLVKFVKYYPGRFLVAWHPKSSMENERTTVVVETPQGKQILLRQIAGAVARRVMCYAKEGQAFQQGDELGFIKFGSRVDLLLPMDTEIHIALNQRVTGKETRIASFRKAQGISAKTL